ncbi:unnamed protein product [Effrenium voratum]|nr:unnamed protein product [Effrenium voratum]
MRAEGVRNGWEGGGRGGRDGRDVWGGWDGQDGWHARDGLSACQPWDGRDGWDGMLGMRCWQRTAATKWDVVRTSAELHICFVRISQMRRPRFTFSLAESVSVDGVVYLVSALLSSICQYLIATSEQPLCAMHAKEILEEDRLPLRYAGLSTCFRTELGKAGKENRGIFRVHQFEKVEQFCLTAGDLVESTKMHEEMLRCAEEFYQALGIPYRVVNVVSGELNDAAIKKFDLEGWFAGQGQYRELVSCSNCTDFQSRALDVRCKKDKRLQHVHMLNATLVAAGRCICCLLEVYQTPTGVRVPPALVPFMGGLDFLPFVREPSRDPKKATKPVQPGA